AHDGIRALHIQPLVSRKLSPSGQNPALAAVSRVSFYPQRPRAPRRTRLRNNRAEFFSSTIAAEKRAQEREDTVARVLVFGMSQQYRARASVRPISRFTAVSRHSRAR